MSSSLDAAATAEKRRLWFQRAKRKSGSSSGGQQSQGSTDGSANPGGPSWLYHNPQQSQFSTPFSSLHYQDIDQARNVSVLREQPTQVVCPSCHHPVVTETSRARGRNNYLVAAALCIACCVPCAVMALFSHKLMDVAHSCSRCGEQIKVFSKE